MPVCGFWIVATHQTCRYVIATNTASHTTTHHMHSVGTQGTRTTVPPLLLPTYQLYQLIQLTVDKTVDIVFGQLAGNQTSHIYTCF